MISFSMKYFNRLLAKKTPSTLDSVKDWLNIETKIMHEPLAYNAPVYKKFTVKKLPVAEKVLKESLVIPSHEKLTDNQIDYVVSNLNYFIEKNEI